MQKCMYALSVSYIVMDNHMHTHLPKKLSLTTSVHINHIRYWISCFDEANSKQTEWFFVAYIFWQSFGKKCFGGGRMDG